MLMIITALQALAFSCRDQFGDFAFNRGFSKKTATNRELFLEEISALGNCLTYRAVRVIGFKTERSQDIELEIEPEADIRFV
jgi:hypothetical protein